MTKKTLESECLLCGSKYDRTGMTRHLQSCLTKEMDTILNQKELKVYPFYHIQVTGTYSPEYWLHLKVKSGSRLKDLDQFLRAIWLECCGHMSAFNYQRNELPMNRKLKEMLSPGMELLYSYDFGSTTKLLVKVIAEYQGLIQKDKSIQILARNVAPKILCDECGKAPAVQICTECQWNEKGWLCQSCVDEHECDEEMLLPVVNSPRTGVCGYEG